MRKTAFIQMTWGFLFILLTFRIQGFDLLPDIIGYILFLVALSTLMKESEGFGTARNLAIILLILSVFEIYQLPTPGVTFDVAIGAPIAIILGIVTYLLKLAFVYQVCSGIAGFSQSLGNLDLPTGAMRAWKHFLTLQILIAVTMVFIFLHIAPFIFMFLFLVILVYSIIVMVLLMQLTYRCSQQL